MRSHFNVYDGKFYFYDFSQCGEKKALTMVDVSALKRDRKISTTNNIYLTISN